jgi:hypothetical protein
MVPAKRKMSLGDERTAKKRRIADGRDSALEQSSSEAASPSPNTVHQNNVGQDEQMSTPLAMDTSSEEVPHEATNPGVTSAFNAHPGTSYFAKSTKLKKKLAAKRAKMAAKKENPRAAEESLFISRKPRVEIARTTQGVPPGWTKRVIVRQAGLYAGKAEIEVLATGIGGNSTAKFR